MKGLERKDVCILTSDLVGALTIRMSGLDPILIKTMPSSRDIHYKALMKRFRTTYWSSTNPDSSAIKLVQRDVTLVILIFPVHPQLYSSNFFVV